MDFQKYATEGNHFINEVMRYLRTNHRDRVSRITKAVLHAIRDRIPPADAIELGQQLPMAMKAIYFDQYTLRGKPVVIRDKRGFLNYIRQKDGNLADYDFHGYDDIIAGLQAVFFVLENHLTAGQILKLRSTLHKEIVELIEG